MKVKVRLFARFRELAGSDTVYVEASSSDEIAERLSELLGVDRSEINLLIDGRRPGEQELREGSDVIAFPPTAGG
ncbi:MAG: MoaD/ThiS family protein [Nitrososphaeria archaeon]